MKRKIIFVSYIRLFVYKPKNASLKKTSMNKRSNFLFAFFLISDFVFGCVSVLFVIVAQFLIILMIIV